LSNIVKPK